MGFYGEDEEDQILEKKVNGSKDFEIKQINSKRYRFYEVDNEIYYPSVTTILDKGTPTPEHLQTWWKENGLLSDHKAKVAANDGTAVHTAIENYLQGVQLEFENYRDREHVWDMIWKFCVFHTEYIDEILDVEKFGVSHVLKTAGTRDLRARLKDGRVGVIDFKTSNYVDDSKFAMQTMAYKQMCIEEGVECDFRAVLHLKATTRDRAKRGNNIQGKGWKLVLFEDDEKDFQKFQLAEQTFWMNHPEAKPIFKRYPMSLSIDRVWSHDEYMQMSIGENEEYTEKE